MSNNGDESSDSYPSVSEDSSDDGYSDEDIEYRHYVNPLMRYIPEAMRSEVRKMCKDTGKHGYTEKEMLLEEFLFIIK
eukprot:XP_016661365.1 PREDICTED: uncharacterized protein LOC107884226 isoform X2 [Acyrthosiphon pisum]